MKLLGWMHRKLMQNSIEPIKNPIIGTASSLSMHTHNEEQNYCMEPTTTTRLSKFKKCEATNFEEESFEPFNFLSIGTFGMELLNTDPPTPTLPVSMDDPMEITKNDLDLINHELEKFLDAQDTELSHDTTSQRSSHASVITLNCYRPSIEGPCSEPACPLQNYLFAASVELAETDKEAKKERASLGELFKRSSIVEEDTVMKKCEGMEQQSRKGNVAHFIKKAVKKLHSSSNPTKKKLSKSIVKMFQKKVYPEEMTDKELLKLSKVKNKSISHEDIHNGPHQIESKRTKKKTIKLSWAGICRGASPENSEYWIKTDSDYLVLEL